MAAVGYGGISAGRVVPRLRDDYIRSLTEEARARLGYRVTKAGTSSHPQTVISEMLGESKRPRKESERKSQSGCDSKGIDNVLTRLSRCCNRFPVIIIGYVTREGVLLRTVRLSQHSGNRRICRVHRKMLSVRRD